MQQLPTRSEVLDALFAAWTPEEKTETIPTAQALGRVLARDHFARYSLPVVRASAMDGVAVDSSRFANGTPDTSAWVLGQDFCRADTGDDFDDRFDAVIPIEEVSLVGGRLTLAPGAAVRPGQNVRPAGSTLQKGALVGQQGRRLRSFDLAALAMGGAAEVEVWQKPRVAFLPTGSELVPLGQAPLRGQNIDSNSVLAANLLREMGAEPLCFPIAADSKAGLVAALDRALAEADIVLLNGGSSKGEEDFNARLLEERGQVLFHWVAAAPGKPLCVAMIGGKPVIDLPGPPLAVLYGMDWCVRAMVCRMLRLPFPRRQTIAGKLTEPIAAPPSMEILCMMDVQKTDGGYNVKQKPWRGGSMADSLTAGAFYTTELGTARKEAGETIEVTLLRGAEDFDHA